jgi:hypothetical protein
MLLLYRTLEADTSNDANSSAPRLPSNCEEIAGLWD